MSEAKQFDISKKAVIAAFQAVKENAGSYGAESTHFVAFPSIVMASPGE